MLGAALRLAFLVAIPECYYGSDSPSYFQAAAKVWSASHHIAFDAKRRWLYPLLLFPLPALPVSPARSLPIIQHLLGLATLFGIGWITGHATKHRRVWVPLVTAACAFLPEMLWCEHEAIGEPVMLAAFVLTVAMAAPARRVLAGRGLFWFLLAAAAIPAVKPHGRGLWLGCVLSVALTTYLNKVRWDMKCAGAIALAFLLMLTAGEKRQGAWLLLNSALPLVNLEGGQWQVYREALKPLVMKARADQGQYAWTQKNFKKALGDGDPASIDPVWASLSHRGEEFNKVCSSLALEGIRLHPAAFAELTLAKIGIALRNCDAVDERFVPAAFWRHEQADLADMWPKDRDRTRVELFYGMDQARLGALVESRAKRRGGIAGAMEAFAPWICWMKAVPDLTGGGLSLRPGSLGILAFLSFLICLLPGRFTKTSMLWLPVALYLVTVFAVGDRKGDYIQPVEWVGFVVIAIGMDAVLERLAGMRRGKQSSAEAGAEETGDCPDSSFLTRNGFEGDDANP